jgi:acetyltransferase-like isoleucine patch superfamily enzyme
VLVLTHTNVGYKDHPLQEYFPASAAPVCIESGSFVGAGVTLLPGVTIGARSVVAAGAVVTEDVPPGTLVAGVPARTVRSLFAPPVP